MSVPRDPDEALRFGLRTIEAAYEEKTRHLDHELQQLRAHTKQQQSTIASMEQRMAQLEQQARESDERARVLADEKALMQQELKTTQRDLSKLDSFKRSILQSIQDEDPAPSMGISALSAAGSVYGSSAPAPLPVMPPPSDYTPAAPSVPTPYGLGSPGPATGSHPLGGGLAASGGAGARLRLSYEQFNQFLSNIKRLNDHAQTRDETLARAQEIFGADNGDLFVSFKTLLSKHGLT